MAKSKERNLMTGGAGASIGIGAKKVRASDEVGAKYLLEVLERASRGELDVITSFVETQTEDWENLSEEDRRFLETMRSAVGSSGDERFTDIKRALNNVPAKVGVELMTKEEVAQFLSLSDDEDDDGAVSEPIPTPIAPASTPAPAPTPAAPAPAPEPATPVSKPVAPKLTSAVPVTASVAPVVLTAANGDGPGYAYKYWDASRRLWLPTTDIWAAKQAGNGVYEPMWVWYKKGQIHHVMDKEEIRKYVP